LFYYCGNLAFVSLFLLLIAPISDLPTQTLIKMPYNLLVVRVSDNLTGIKEVMSPITFKVQNSSTILSSEVGEGETALLKGENKVAYCAPDFGRDSTMVSQ